MRRIVTLTDAGLRLGRRLQQLLPNSILNHRPEPFTQSVQTAFNDKDELIMICATGIVFRTIAPVINNKHQDPAVIVMDESGEYVVPLLSGHEGGANELAAQVADLIDAQVVITTAKPYLKPIYTVGMGCERHCSQTEMDALLTGCLSGAGLSIDDIESINSIDLKQDEIGLIALADASVKPFRVYDKDQLTVEHELLSTRSEYVFKTVGVYGVAESAALHAARQLTGDSAELILNKQKSQRATCAIARGYPRKSSLK